MVLLTWFCPLERGGMDALSRGSIYDICPDKFMKTPALGQHTPL